MEKRLLIIRGGNTDDYVSGNKKVMEVGVIIIMVIVGMTLQVECFLLHFKSRLQGKQFILWSEIFFAIPGNIAVSRDM